MDSATTRNSLVLIAVVAVGAALYWMRDIVTPLVLAIFLGFLIDGLRRAILRHVPFLPDPAAVPVSLLLILVAFLGSLWIIADGLAGFVDQLRTFAERADTLIAQAASLLGFSEQPPSLQVLLQNALETLEPTQLTAAAPTLFKGLSGAAAVLGFGFFVLVYLGFLLASGDNFRRKVVVLFPEREDRKDAVHVFDRVRSGVEGYIWVQTVTGLIIALGCYAAMAAVGLENALFWAFLIFLLSYIPIIGGVVAGMGPPLFALFQFETYWQALVLLAVIQVILQVVGNIILPKMQADDQNIDPIVVLLSLAFWGAIWGVTGAFLSTPLTVMAMAIMAEFKGSRWIAVLLSGDGDPYPEPDEGPGVDAETERESPPRPKPKPPAKKASPKTAR